MQPCPEQFAAMAKTLFYISLAVLVITILVSVYPSKYFVKDNNEQE